MSELAEGPEKIYPTLPEKIKEWVPAIAVSIAAFPVFLAAAIHAFGLQTISQHQEIMMEYEARTQGQITEVRSEVDDLHTEIRQLDNAIQCILWEVPAERCAAARRP